MMDNKVRWAVEQQAEALNGWASFLHSWGETQASEAMYAAAEALERCLKADKESAQS